MKYYKTTKKGGKSFHGNVQYRVGKTVRLKPVDRPELCTDSVLHASRKAIDALGYAGELDCDLFEVGGKPVVEDETKSGFFALKVLREIPDSEKDAIYGFKFNEALHPMDPSTIICGKITDADIALLNQWASVWDSVRDSVWGSVRASVVDSVWDSVWDFVWASVRASVMDSVWASVMDSVWASVWASVRASVVDSVGASVRASVNASFWAYIGSLFPNITKWKYVKESGDYPFQPAIDLWKRGLVPVKVDGEWRLYHPVRNKPAKLMYDAKRQKEANRG